MYSRTDDDDMDDDDDEKMFHYVCIVYSMYTCVCNNL